MRAGDRAGRRRRRPRGGSIGRSRRAIAASIAAGPAAPAGRRRGSGVRPPSCPSARPAGRRASSDAPSVACGHASSRRAPAGIGAGAMASASGRAPIPNPSRTTRTIGRGRPTPDRSRVVTDRSRRRRVPGRSVPHAPTMPAIRRVSARRRRLARRRCTVRRGTPRCRPGHAAAVEDRHGVGVHPLGQHPSRIGGRHPRRVGTTDAFARCRSPRQARRR